ncbi:MAG: PDZ domain-containing protein [Clostridiaceae bacterium]|nr:PDZ domain-containing protein [Clostridiaceae bacterium]
MEDNFQYGQQYTQNQVQPADSLPMEIPTSKKKTRKTVWKRFGIILTAIACVIVSGVAGAGGGFLANIYFQDNQNQAAEVQATGDTSTILEGNRKNSIVQIAQVNTSEIMTAAEVYALNVNSTVGITTSASTNFGGYQATSSSSGSGFILTDDGNILVNYHVIEGAESITVSTYSEQDYDAELIGYDENNDIAVLKIEADDLTPVVLGDSDNLNVGDSVLAIGNPLGELTFSLTTGAISALDREITLSGNTTMTLLQTDCAINSGNSGGALFNLYGEVIGITNAKYSSSSFSSEASIDNIGFAIPINQIKQVVTGIIEDGYISKPYIGVSVIDVSTEMQDYGLPGGAAIKQITEDSPAEQAGLQINDIVTAIDGNSISGSNDLAKVISSSSVGDILKMSVHRNGEIIDIQVTIGEQKQEVLANQEKQTAQQYPAGQEQQNGTGNPEGYGGYNEFESRR